MITKLQSLWLALVLSLAAVCATAPAGAAAPERRVALVIGNGAYRFAPALENPTIDARGVAAALRRIGFEVIDGYDLGFLEMRAKLAEFAGAIADTKAALVYYAGHGVSVEDENFLLPVDISLKSVTDLDINAINIDLILRQGQIGETYCVGGASERANIDVVRALLAILGKDESSIEYVTDRPGHDRRYAINFSKIEHELGWKPTVSFEEGLRQTVEWFKENRGWWERVRSSAYLEYYAKQYEK